ncbi:hypothetical protein [Lentzea fradiae]|uniref:hypothetical protein n=1 Tax=Lentzea fradiae TaxID=200378 RepID=UPI000B7D6B9B|nr:hypothetical protein [Lentzea fradiae]
MTAEDDVRSAVAAAREYADRFGEPDADELARIRADLVAAGVGVPEPPADAAARAAALARLLA